MTVGLLLYCRAEFTRSVSLHCFETILEGERRRLLEGRVQYEVYTSKGFFFFFLILDVNLRVGVYYIIYGGWVMNLSGLLSPRKRPFTEAASITYGLIAQREFLHYF